MTTAPGGQRSCYATAATPFFSFPFPSRSLEKGPLNTARCLEKLCKPLQRGLERSPRGKQIWCFSDTPILLISLRINEHTGQLLIGLNALTVCGPPNLNFGLAIPPSSLCNVCVCCVDLTLFQFHLLAKMKATSPHGHAQHQLTKHEKIMSLTNI